MPASRVQPDLDRVRRSSSDSPGASFDRRTSYASSADGASFQSGARSPGGHRGSIMGSLNGGKEQAKDKRKSYSRMAGEGMLSNRDALRKLGGAGNAVVATIALQNGAQLREPGSVLSSELVSEDGSKAGDSTHNGNAFAFFARRSSSFQPPDMQRKASDVQSLAISRAIAMEDRPLPVQLVMRFCSWFNTSGSEGCEQIISLLFLWMIPFQVAFEHRVVFGPSYWVGYTLDFLMIAVRLPPALFSCRAMCSLSEEEHKRRTHRRKACRSAVQLLLVLPYDLTLWGSAAQSFVPYLRLSRLVFAPAQLDSGLRVLERSQALAFQVSRAIRLFVVFTLAGHWIGCLFHLVCRQEGARHYATVPWRLEPYGEEGHNATDVAPFAAYLTASYWSFMSLTTTGHVDIIEQSDADINEQLWEFGFAIVVIWLASIVFIYVNANCTSLMLKLNQRLEQYRTRLQGVDVYLKRNQVSKEVQRSVKRHFRKSFDEDQINSDSHAVLDAMPRYLRRTVLQDIHMRTLRRAPLFVGVDKEMIAQVCAVVRRVVYHPEELLCKQGDVMNEMYILEEGQLIQVTEPDETEGPDEASFNHRGGSENFDAGSDFGGGGSCESFDGGGGGAMTRRAARRLSTGSIKQPTYRIVHEPGSAVCELPLLFGLRQQASVEAVKLSTVLVLQKSDFAMLSKDFPDSLDKIHQNEKTRLEYDEDRETLDAIEKLHSLKSQQQIAQLSDAQFAAATGEVDVVRQALSEGKVDRHEMDPERRTFLHLAASAGQLSVVKLLLDEYKVALNRRDAFQKTALANAISRGHSAVANELCEAGAELGWEETDVASALCDRTRQGLLPELRLLVKCGASVNAADYDKRTCLHLAASEGLHTLAAFLLEAGAQINAKDRWGGTPLRDAVREGHHAVAKHLRSQGAELGYTPIETSAELCELARAGELVRLKLMIACGADMNAADYDERTCLHLAASEGNAPIVDFLLSHGARVNAQDRFGSTPLSDAIKHDHWALADSIRQHGGQLLYTEEQASGELCELARKGKKDALGYMVRCGAPINAADYDRRTCLHLAASEGNAPIVEFLLENAANINAKDRWGGTPLRDAVREGHHAVAKHLRSQGAELGYTEVEASGELCELARTGCQERLALLVDCGADVNAADYDKRTCLHLAASEGNKPLVECLLGLKAHMNAKDRWGGTPLRDAVREGHHAVAKHLRSQGAELGYTEVEASGELCELCRAGSLETLQLAVSCGAQINAADYDRRTPLHLAASEGNARIVEYLLDSGGDMHAKDRWGGTPLVDAVREGHSTVAQLLRDRGATMG